ncbi:MAG: GNAT family N-acetyltransferase [Actinomycetota bacterium]
MDPDFRLETDRLRLRAYRRDDVDELAPMFADPDHMRWYPAPFTREETERWVERQHERYRDDGFGLWVIEDRRTGEFLGTAGPTIQFVEDVREVELGWHVRPGHKGEGIAPEAGAAARDWAFASLDVAHLISLIRPENRASARVAEKLGMRVDREVDHHRLRHAVYRIDRPPPA